MRGHIKIKNILKNNKLPVDGEEATALPDVEHCSSREVTFSSLSISFESSSPDMVLVADLKQQSKQVSAIIVTYYTSSADCNP